MKHLMVALVGLMTMSGCSMLTTGPGKTPQDWEKMAPTIERRIQYVAAFAFTIKSVSEHKDAVCAALINAGEKLKDYNDKDASFEQISAMVHKIVDATLENSPQYREAAHMVVDIVITEAFNYAWERYADLIEQDQARVSIIITQAIGRGFLKACSGEISGFLLENQTAMKIFTVRK